MDASDIPTTVSRRTTGSTQATFAILLLCAVSGITGSTLAKADVPSATSPSVVILDERPAAEKATKKGSGPITSCDFAVTQLGDTDLSFDRIASLRSALEAAGPGKAAGKEVALHHYGIYLNPAEIFRRSFDAVARHRIDVSTVDPGSRCTQEQMSGGWYGPGESTTRFAPIIVEIGFVLDGVRYDIHNVYSPDGDPVRYRSAKSAAFVATAAHQAEQAVVQRLLQ